MMRRIISIALVIIALTGTKALAQNLSMPDLSSVSINPETGAVEIRWNNSNDPNITFTEVSRQPFYGGVYSFNPIASLPLPASSYTDNGVSQINNNIQTYRIRSSNPTQTSQNTSMHITMRANASYNACKNEIYVGWTSYKQYFIDAFGRIVEPHEPEETFNKAVKYEVWGYEGTGNFTEALATKLGNLTSANVDTLRNVTSNSNYFLFVKALLPNNNIATSYHLPISTLTRKEPDYMVIDSVITSKGSIHLYFNIDPTTQLDTFALYRNDINKPISWFWQRPQSYVDSDVQLGLNYNYSLAVYRCGRMIKQSDTVNNIILHVNSVGQSTSLKWTDFTNLSSLYSVTRIEPQPSTVIYSAYDIFKLTDNVQSLLEDGNFEYCYSVKANNGKSIARSEKQCVTLQPIITMPDAINPESNIMNSITGRRRNQFGPVLAFKDNRYRFTLEIFNRAGVRLFRGEKQFEDALSTQHFWDGRYNNSYVKEDIYIYSLKFQFKNSDSFIQNGTVAVVYR